MSVVLSIAATFLILFSSEFVILEVVNFVFGDDVELGSFVAIAILIITMIATRAAAEAIYHTLGTNPGPESRAPRNQEVNEMQHAFHISRVVFGADGFGEITNGSDQPADTAGLLLCQFPAYPAVPVGSVEPGESVRVAAGDLGGLNASDGELALYIEPSFEDPDAVASYVQWGSVGHKREHPAIAGGAWLGASFVDAAAATEMRADRTAVAAANWALT